MAERRKDTIDRFRKDIDRGRAGDKTDYPDPAAAPLGTDDEAGGHPVSEEQLRIARQAEMRRPSRPDEEAPAEDRSRGRPSSAEETDARAGNKARRNPFPPAPQPEETDMVTTVGTERDVRTLVTDFIQLEHDAIAAYETCIERLDATHRRERIAEFLSDHERHLSELHDIARQVGAEIPDEPGMKSMLTTGKVAFADMMGGDGAILKAMSTNETDTVTAYERGMRHADLDTEARAVFERAHSDELRHKSWMEAEARAA